MDMKTLKFPRGWQSNFDKRLTVLQGDIETIEYLDRTWFKIHIPGVYIIDDYQSRIEWIEKISKDNGVK